MALLRACLKSTALALLVAVIFPAQWLLRPSDALGSRSARWWHRALRGALGLSVEIVGRPLQNGQVAYVGNHLSYLDIPLVGSILRGRFVAKDAVRGWPLFGALAALQQTIFISRVSRDARGAIDRLDAALAAGDNLILFPEGTSSNGSRVLPFKASAFAALAPRMADGLRVQPFTIDLVAVDGRGIDGDAARDRYAYHGDAVLGPHLWAFLHARGARLRLTFHAPLAVREDIGRKRLAALAHDAVASGLASRPASCAAAA